ncbi:hypothetical protein SUDANB120_04874 [Streptomyces sp. enrichment culture]|uniref:TIGR04222 domain-containing membrane protein n=1 Tax=Streptomyces sp. enrichment culture TaxID=1795815 RepID=UPI003F57203D
MNGSAVVWLAVAVSSVLLVGALRRTRPRTGGEQPRLLDLSEAAFLTGGPGGVVDTALVALLGDGRLTAGGPGIVQARPGAPAADTAERAVLRACGQAPSGWLYQVRYAAMRDPAVQEVGDGLAARGLLAAPGRGRGVRLWAVVQAAVCGVLLLLSLPLVLFTLAVSGGGVSVPFALLVGAVVGAVCARRAARRVTPQGRRALRAMRALYVGDGSPQAQTALFGLRTLRDPYLGPLLIPAARQARLAAAQHQAQAGRSRGGSGDGGSDGCGSSGAEAVPVVWCAGSADSGGGSGCGSSGDSGWGGSGCGSSGGSSCSGSSGSSCSGSSSSCSSSSSSS